MPPNDLSQTRVARLAARHRGRGAVVFIVAATLTLLALLGVYAMNSASTEVRTSGYVRQSSQAHYLSEYTMGAVANHVNATNADTLVFRLTGSAPDPRCFSTPTYTTAPLFSRYCIYLDSPQFEQPWAGRPTLTPYSLGQAGVTTMQGLVFAEVSNPVTAQQPPGFDQALQYVRVTVTTGGSVQAGGLDPNRPDSRTLETGRARMLIGPIRRR